MKVWMSNSTRNKKGHTKRQTLLVFGSIFLAVRVGMAAGRDVMIFCQDDNYDMFVVNALTYIDIKRGVQDMFPWQIRRRMS